MQAVCRRGGVKEDFYGAKYHNIYVFLNMMISNLRILPDGVDQDTGGESGHRLKMFLKPRK